MLVLQIWCTAVVLAIDPNCQAVIDANQQSLDAIRTIQLEYTVAFPDNPSYKPDSTRWIRDGKLERIHRLAGNFPPRQDGRPNGISDELIDGKTFKRLTNWDPRNPQKITPLNPGTVRASTGPQLNALAGSPAQQLLFEVSGVPRRTLSDLAKVSPKVVCKGLVQMNGQPLFLISLEAPEQTTPTTTKYFYDVYLDPEVGYMIRKLVVTAPEIILGDGKRTSDAHAHEVVEFKDCGGGVFVPIRIRNGTLDKYGSELVVDSVSVNEPVPREAFEWNWPKYVTVTHVPPVNGKLKMEIWGDGKPLREVGGAGDIRALEMQLRSDPAIAAELGPLLGEPEVPPPPSSTLARLSIVLVALVVVMAILILVRRLREQTR